MSERIEGDLLVGRNIYAGGDLNIPGNATIKRNLKVNGWLEVKNIKAANKGLFASWDALNEAYPNPEQGWWAIVGKTLPGPIYVGDGGEWKATGEEGGSPTIEIESNNQAIAELQNDLKTLSAKHQDIKQNIGTISGELELMREAILHSVDYENSYIVDGFQIGNSIGGQLASSSTFSGFGMYVGKLNPFRYILVHVKAADWDDNTSPIKELLLQIKQHDNTGDVLRSMTLQVNIEPGEVKPIMFDFGEEVSFNDELFVEVRADRVATLMKAAQSNYPYLPTDGTTYPKFIYWINGNIDPTNKGIAVSGGATMWAFFFQTFLTVEYTTEVSKDVVEYISNNMTLSPLAISLPDKIWTVVGDTLQLFYRGIVRAVDPYRYNIVVKCAKGNQYPRFFEYTPMVADVGETPFTIVVKDDNGNVLAEKSATLITSVVPTSSNAINVACIGDSLTAPGIWCGEAYRRLAESGGMPEGNKLRNIKFIGSMGSGGAKFFGVGGWSWSSYTTAGKPAYRFAVSGVGSLEVNAVYSNNGGRFTIKEVNVSGAEGNILCSVDNLSVIPTTSGVLTKVSGNGDAEIAFTSAMVDAQNPLWDVTNNKMSFIPYANEVGNPDIVCVMLGWNSITPWQTDFTSMLAHVKTFADTLHREYPKAKLKIMGLQVPCVLGGIGKNYGATGQGYADGYGLAASVFALNEAYQAFANQEGYDEWVEFVNISTEFDSEWNMQLSESPVNTRNSNVEWRGKNGLHPGSNGYLQIGDAIYRNIINSIK